MNWKAWAVRLVAAVLFLYPLPEYYGMIGWPGHFRFRIAGAVLLALFCSGLLSSLLGAVIDARNVWGKD